MSPLDHRKARHAIRQVSPQPIPKRVTRAGRTSWFLRREKGLGLGFCRWLRTALRNWANVREGRGLGPEERSGHGPAVPPR